MRPFTYLSERGGGPIFSAHTRPIIESRQPGPETFTFLSLESREGCRVNRRPSHQRLTSERSFEMRRLRPTEARENSPPLAKSANWRLAKCRITAPQNSFGAMPRTRSIAELSAQRYATCVEEDITTKIRSLLPFRSAGTKKKPDLSGE